MAATANRSHYDTHRCSAQCTILVKACPAAAATAAALPLACGLAWSTTTTPIPPPARLGWQRKGGFEGPLPRDVRPWPATLPCVSRPAGCFVLVEPIKTPRSWSGSPIIKHIDEHVRPPRLHACLATISQPSSLRPAVERAAFWQFVCGNRLGSLPLRPGICKAVERVLWSLPG